MGHRPPMKAAFARFWERAQRDDVTATQALALISALPAPPYLDIALDGLRVRS